jgi:predicted lysophospholipase L1 biosynthesis ABC-type transport system permease subunit
MPNKLALRPMAPSPVASSPNDSQRRPGSAATFDRGKGPAARTGSAGHRRTREIGLRMALGADRGAVLRMILRGAVGMAAIGICLGVVIALALGRYVESQLYGIRGSDLLTLGGAAGVLVLVVLASGWLPARRASRVDPMLALRCE